MHQGGRETRKDPGSDIWVFDVKTQKRVQQIKLAVPATSIAVSGDDKPLLYTIAFGSRDLTIYDASSGEKLRTVGELGESLTILQPAPVGN